MCSISEEDESRNVSHLEEIKQTDKNNYTSKENKFQSVNYIGNTIINKEREFNQSNNEEIEESYNQEFDDYLVSHDLKSNKLLTNDLNAIKNQSQGHSVKFQEIAMKTKPILSNNQLKNSSVIIDNLLQSKYSNYSYNFDENVQSMEYSIVKGNNSKKREVSQTKNKSEINEEVNHIFKLDKSI